MKKQLTALIFALCLCLSACEIILLMENPTESEHGSDLISTDAENSGTPESSESTQLGETTADPIPSSESETTTTQEEDDYLFETSETTYSEDEPDDMGQTEQERIAALWLVEPELEYEHIYYCSVCAVFGSDYHEGDILDPKTGQVTDDESITKNGWQGHGLGSVTWLYDEAQSLYGLYFEGDGVSYEAYPKGEFIEAYSSWHQNSLVAFREFDSSKVKKQTTEWGDEYYDLDEAYTSDKFAFVYDFEFVSGFIYDYDIYESHPDDKAAARLGDKWGVIDKNGDTLLPFSFEHILFTDTSTAFAKYGGKYGIISVAHG